MAKQKTRSTVEAPATAAEYTVMARRYRPQQFADLIGQEAVARALTNAIQNDRVAHAYLFTGVRGTGKTSTARILAKALDCEKGPTPTPCDRCEICLSIASGQDVDVLEIDGASNNKAEEARDLRQTVGTRPTRARYKIYIIDEVHMLSTAAFNVLLKTLEEPPPHVKFIFATTEIQKVPLTILSRCQRFDFTGITSTKIAKHLQEIVATEGMEADADALMILARRAGGSMRDAQSLLDQLLSFDGQKLTADKVHQLLGTATDERMLKLVDAMVARDAKLAFELLTRFHEEGLQLGELLDQLVEYWRSLMLLNCAGKNAADVALSEVNRDKAFQHSQSLALDSILAGLDVLTTTKSRLRGTNHGLILLEMAVLRLIRLDELVPVAQLAQWFSQPDAGKPIPKSGAIQPLPSVDLAKKKLVAAPEPVSLPSVSETNLSVTELWSKVVEAEGPALIGNLAVGSPPAIIGPNTLAIHFASRYTSQYDYCSQARNIEEVQKTLQKITGEPWKFRLELERPTVEAAAADEAEVKATKQVTHRERSQEVLKIPLISSAADKLGARLLKIDEGFGSGNVPLPEPDVADLQEP